MTHDVSDLLSWPTENFTMLPNGISKAKQGSFGITRSVAKSETFDTATAWLFWLFSELLFHNRSKQKRIQATTPLSHSRSNNINESSGSNVVEPWQHRNFPTSSYSRTSISFLNWCCICSACLTFLGHFISKWPRMSVWEVPDKAQKRLTGSLWRSESTSERYWLSGFYRLTSLMSHFCKDNQECVWIENIMLQH